MEPKRAYKRVLIDEELREIASALRHAECAVSEALSHRKGGPVTERAVQSRRHATLLNDTPRPLPTRARPHAVPSAPGTARVRPARRRYQPYTHLVSTRFATARP